MDNDKNLISEDEVIGLLESVISIKTDENINISKNIGNLEVKLDVLKQMILDFKRYNFDDLEINKMMIVLQLQYIFDGDLYTNKFQYMINDIKYHLSNSHNKSAQNAFAKFIRFLEAKSVRFENELLLLNKDYNENQNIIKNNARIIRKLKYKQGIIKDDLLTLFTFFKDIADDKGYSKFAIYKFCEEVRFRNNSKLTLKQIDNMKNQLLNAIKTGFEIFPELESYDDSSYSDNMVSSLFQLVNSGDFNTETLMNVCQYDSYLYDENEYRKIYYDFMRKLQQEIYDHIEFVEDPEYYCDNDSYNNIMKDYRKLVHALIVSRNFFDSEILKLEEEKLNEKIMLENINSSEEEIKTKFYFLKTARGESHFENDLKKLREEAYVPAINLLKKKRFINPGGAYDKTFKGNQNFVGFSELKDDQIRIVYKPYKNNTIIICGVDIKKSDNDLRLYNTLTGRMKDFNEEVFDDIETFNQIEEMYTNMARKGSR